MRSLRDGGRAQTFDPVVYKNPAAGGARDSNGRKGFCSLYADELPADLFELDAQHSRLDHLAAVVVGSPDSGVALLMWRNCRGARNAEFVSDVWGIRIKAGSGCSGHMVFVRSIAVYLVRVAGGD